MYLLEVDDLFDSILDNFYNYISNEKIFEKILKDTNFVKFNNIILDTIKKFIDTISKKDILNIIKKEIYYNDIINIIKRYCAFYVYLGIAYYYEGSRDLYITNILEISRYQKDAIYQIVNFFNTENNSKIILFYNNIKNILSLLQLKNIDKIKIVLSNNILKYESTLKLFNDLGEDYFIEYFLIENNFHNIIKCLIFTQIYIKEEKNNIINLLIQDDKENAEYKYIDIIVSNEKKIVDFNIIQKFLNIQQLKYGLAEEIYNYLEENKKKNELIIKDNQDFINYLFSNEIIIPITEDFLRYHKDSEKYDPESLIVNENIKDRDATKIKYIINKMNKIRNYNVQDNSTKKESNKNKEYIFYKPLDPKMAVLFNENEEIKIIKKLQLLDNSSDYDLLIELENIRKYAYVNFKNLSINSIKIRPLKTIQVIRATSLLQNKKTNLDLRVSHNYLDVNIVGIAFNPSKISLDCFLVEDLINVKTKSTQNGYHSFIKTMINKFDESSNTKKIYYWLFDSTTDKPELNSYINYNVNDIKNNINIMLEGIYNTYIELAKNNIIKYFDNIDNFNLIYLDRILKNKKNFDFSLNTEINNEIINKIIFEKYPEYDIIEDDIDSLIPGKNKKLIKLPNIDINSVIKKNVIALRENKIINDNNEFFNKKLVICQHYNKWNNINKLSKKSDDFNQAIFDFGKQYVKIGEHDQYLCKSCNEVLQIQKFIVDGTFIEELDMFLTTSLIVNFKLEEISKYSKYTRSIRNIEKNIEKLGYIINYISLIGNTPVIKLRRKNIIKDIIDIILIHTEWLKNQQKDRIEQFSKKYGINKDYTNLFFFELKDDIFLTRSTDTDYYKIIKYNNIMVYLLLVIILDINLGQLLNFPEDKKYNFYLFNKIKDNLFNNLYLRINQKEKIEFNNIPVLAYTIFYLSGIMISNKLWLYNDNNIDKKDKPLYFINLQKTIIHTFIDLLNSISEANMDMNKNYLYEVINARISIKLTTLFNDLNLFKKLELKNLNNISIDQVTNKININFKKIEFIELKNDYNLIEKNNIICDLSVNELFKIPIKKDSNNIDILTNCPNGSFHNWVYKSNDLVCNICNKSYNDLTKLVNTTSDNQDFDFLNKILIINLKKLALKYCISGEMHDFNNGICNKCHININNYDPSLKELKKLEKNINEKTNEIIISNIQKMQKNNELLKKEKIKINNVLLKLLKNYNRNTQNNLENYINFFIDKLIKIIGNKIKINNDTIYLKDTLYIIDHDYLGNNIKNNIFISSTDNKIILTYNHPIFKRDILYYNDKNNKVFVYYDYITLQYLGYSEDNKNIIKTKKNVSLIINLSIKDCLLLLGYENRYLNLYFINDDFIKEIPKDFNDQITNDLIISIIRNRINNLHHIIARIIAIIYNIKNNGKIKSIYNTEENNLINEYSKKIKKINIKDDKNHNIIFKNNKIITNNLFINYKIPNIKLNINKNYIDISNLILLNNSDTKLIFYLINNLSKLLDYNKDLGLESELAVLIIKIIKYLFNVYYKPLTNYNVRKFDFILINEAPYVDDTVKVVGNYQELLTQQEIDDPEMKEQLYSAKEEFNAFDIDDYEVDDDIDYAVDALDGDLNE
jgi:hypothetical protein